MVGNVTDFCQKWGKGFAKGAAQSNQTFPWEYNPRGNLQFSVSGAFRTRFFLFQCFQDFIVNHRLCPSVGFLRNLITLLHQNVSPKSRKIYEQTSPFRS